MYAEGTGQQAEARDLCNNVLLCPPRGRRPVDVDARCCAAHPVAVPPITSYAYGVGISAASFFATSLKIERCGFLSRLLMSTELIQLEVIPHRLLA